MLRILSLRGLLILYLYRKFIKFISTPSRNSRLKIFYFDLIVVADRFALQIRRAGLWNADIMSTTYLTNFSRKYMRVVVGHYHHDQYFLSRVFVTLL